MRFTKGKHAFVVATHTEIAVLKNHIINYAKTRDVYAAYGLCEGVGRFTSGNTGSRTV